MGSDQHERRRFKRVFFSSEDDISGRFELPYPADTHIIAQIMDLSEEGIGITISKDKCPPIQRGDCLTLTHVDHQDGLAFITNTQLEIKWILKHRSLDHVGLGCQFNPLPEEIRQRIIAFMAVWGERKMKESKML